MRGRSGDGAAFAYAKGVDFTSKEISASAFVAEILDKVRTPAIPYVLGGRNVRGTDCINLIGWCVDNLGGAKVPRSSNEAWNKNMVQKAFIHDGGTNHGGGLLIPGALLYIDYSDTVTQSAKGTPGKMDHVGVYVGPVPGLITPDGKQGEVVHASQSRGGVYASMLKNAWTHVAWLAGIDYTETGTATPIAASTAEQPASSEPAPGQAQVITSTSGLYLRKLPNKDSAKIREMPAGTIVTVLRVEGDWARVRWDVKSGLYHIGWCRVGENGITYLKLRRNDET